MNYFHIDSQVIQHSRTGQSVCGDSYFIERNSEGTTIILADGRGHGIKASISSKMFISRIKTLIDEGYSLRESVESLVKTNKDNRMNNLPYSVFIVCKILNNGETSFLRYDIPEPVFISRHKAYKLKDRSINLNNELIYESSCFIEPGESIFICTDGITQSGTGIISNEGWTIDGVIEFINKKIRKRTDKNNLLKEIIYESYINSKNFYGDDTTGILLNCTKGKTVNIFTGPPFNSERDYEAVKEFMSAPGVKVICGDTTSKVIARETGSDIKVSQPENYVDPPTYIIDDIYLATEGAITLNQVYNIFDEDPDKIGYKGPISTLYCLLNAAHRINIFHGTAFNHGKEDIAFTQKGILSRELIIKLLSKKLRKAGKLVNIKVY